LHDETRIDRQTPNIAAYRPGQPRRRRVSRRTVLW